MKYYGKKEQISNDAIENMIAPSGATFPPATEGELYALKGHATIDDGLYVYLNGIWRPAGSGTVGGIDTGWRDYIQRLGTTRAANDKPPIWKSFNGNLGCWHFRNGQVNEMQIEFHFNHDYKLGTVVYPHIHWMSPPGATGTVRWGFEYVAAKSHGRGLFSGNTTTIYLEETVDGRDYPHMVTEAALAQAIPATELEADTVLICRMFRDGTHANDTCNQDIGAFQCDLHYQYDRMGTPNKEPDFYT